jgi:hypothetical protein
MVWAVIQRRVFLWWKAAGDRGVNLWSLFRGFLVGVGVGGVSGLRGIVGISRKGLIQGLLSLGRFGLSTFLWGFGLMGNRGQMDGSKGEFEIKGKYGKPEISAQYLKANNGLYTTSLGIRKSADTFKRDSSEKIQKNDLTAKNIFG